MDFGDVFIGDKRANEIPPAGRGLAMVFQSYALYPHMTVFENMAFALGVRKLKKSEIEERVMSTAKTLKIDQLLHRKPKELSGGQRQRVAIGRAIVRNPFAFLFDEPLSNLDSSLRCQMRYELARLKAQLKTTMVYVTHDQAEAMTLADKIVVMRDGNIEQEGAPLEVYNSPVNIFVARFIGSSEMNILNGTFLKCVGKLAVFQLETGEEISVRCPNNVEYSADAVYSIGIRPEDVEILDAENILFLGNRLDGVVLLAENLGGGGFIHITLQNGSQLSVKAVKAIKEQNGQTVKVGFSFNKCYIFNQDGNTVVARNAALMENK
jgi:ABC-type sugar transport system ATPase subunit